VAKETTMRKNCHAGSHRFPRLFRPRNSKTKVLSSLNESDKSVDTGSEDSDFSVASSITEEAGYRFSHDDDHFAAKMSHPENPVEMGRIQPMMARLDALQIQQQMQGMNHPDVLFALKHLARAHRRRGETQQAQLVEEMLRAGQEDNFGSL
jgi:hypothetical protein